MHSQLVKVVNEFNQNDAETLSGLVLTPAPGVAATQLCM